MSHPIEDPLAHISYLFDQHLAQNLSTPNSSSTFDPSKEFLQILNDHKHNIISINDTPAQQVPKNTLVRFRCMIQDTGLSQEMFVSAYEKQDANGNMKLQCYRYTDDPIDSEHVNGNELQNNHLAERSIIYCVSPPGENKWSKDAHNINSGSLNDQMSRLDIKQQANEAIFKKYPLPNQDHISALVKFYDDMGENVRVGQLVEIIGIRGQGLHQQSTEEAASETSEFDSILDLHFSNTPVVHAIAYKNLEAINSNPIIQDESSAASTADDCQKVRAELVKYIASALGGDELTAEFVLLQLVSRVNVKNRGLKIGNFTLNITGFPLHQTTEEEKKQKTSFLTLNNPASKRLSDILETLTVHYVGLPLTIDGLNKMKFSPKSINESLEAGVLQLVDGTAVLIDETVLEEGQLVDPGVRNFQALENLIKNQTLTYEFPYSQFDFDTDVGIVSLSNSNSMLPNHCSIKIQPKQSFEEAAKNSMTPPKETLDLFRRLIHTAKYGEYDITEDVSEYIQTAFVNKRKEATTNKTQLPSQEDLMLHMNLARLTAVSFGEKSLTKERYDYAVDLDSKRKSTLPPVPTTATATNNKN